MKNKQTPLASIIIPVYNAEKTISDIITKILQQSYRNIELIVVNDGSDDGSLRNIRRHEKDKRLVVVDQKNAGASAARNAGIDRATGELMMFFDADDDFDKDIIKNMVEKYQKSDTNLVVCGMSINGRSVTAQDEIISRSKNIVRYVLKSLLKQNLFYGPYCKLFKTEIINSTRLRFNTEMKYGEDTVFVMRYVSTISGLSMISQPLYYYNYSTDGVAFRNRKNSNDRAMRRRELFRLLKKQINLFNISLTIAILLRWWLSSLKARVGMK